MNQAFNGIIKKNVSLLVLSVFAVVLLVTSVSYAFSQVEDRNTENQVISIGTLDADLTSIDGAVEIKDIYPIKEELLGDDNKYTFKISNNGDYDLKYTIHLEDNTENVKNDYADYEPLDTSLFRYINYKIDNMGKHNLEESYDSETGKMEIMNGILSSDIEEEHFIQFWLDEKAPNSMIGKVLSLNIYFDGVATMAPAKMTLLSLNQKEQKSVPNFENGAVTDETVEGLYEITDDYGLGYYYRGASSNNYVKFGKSAKGQDMFWRIIRINGDGTIRMIYDGDEAYPNGIPNENRIAFKSGWNSDTANMSYIADDQNSPIKEKMDKWYETNIIGTGLEDYIADRIFCSDFTQTSNIDDEYGITYGAYSRLVTNKNPRVKCSRQEDAYSVNDKEGNGLLKYPVGLISADEVALAGGKRGLANMSYYLFKGISYYTFSPMASSDDSTEIFNDSLNGTTLDTELGVSPVINLDVKTSRSLHGTGTASNPYSLD